MKFRVVSIITLLIVLLIWGTVYIISVYPAGKESAPPKRLPKELLHNASQHPMCYYLSLPHGWNDRRKWPILVAVEGAGCDWACIYNAYIKVRGDLPFIIVVPQTFSNTNELLKRNYDYPSDLVDKYNTGGFMGSERKHFDMEGLLNIIDDVVKKWQGEEKFYITGHSGGGHLVWSMVFCHPDKLNMASPCCANFLITPTVAPGFQFEKENLPVRAFQGEKDPYIVLMNSQWARVKAVCDSQGFKNVSRETVPGLGHDYCARQVMDFFRNQEEELEKKMKSQRKE